MPRTVLSRATDAVASKFDRRRFLTRTAVLGSALVTAPADVLLRPQSAYAAVCSCIGKSCPCGSLCCDGYTEFCCALHGLNACPSGSIIGGWWKADGSSFCGGKARYYMDCHKPCGGCSCGGSGICSGSCNGTPCGCGNGRCDHRKAGCTSFRYGNCSNHRACVGPIQCRVVSCTEPWKLEPTCSSAAVRTDNNTRSHNRPCLQAVPPITMVAGDWNGDAKTGIGWYDNRTARWTLRQTGMTGPIPPFGYGRTAGDRPVVGDWDGTGGDSIAIVRGNQWHFARTVGTGTAAYYISPPWGLASDLPVAGDWNGDGVDTPGLFRPKAGMWYLSHRVENPTTARRVDFGGVGDIPVVGDWDGDGIDGVGVFRRGMWYLTDNVAIPNVDRRIRLGQAGDQPVVGDWHRLGRVSIGVYRPSTGTWYLRKTLDDPKLLIFKWGPKWTIG